MTIRTALDFLLPLLVTVALVAGLLYGLVALVPAIGIALHVHPAVYWGTEGLLHWCRTELDGLRHEATQAGRFARPSSPSPARTKSASGAPANS